MILKVHQSSHTKNREGNFQVQGQIPVSKNAETAHHYLKWFSSFYNFPEAPITLMCDYSPAKYWMVEFFGDLVVQ